MTRATPLIRSEVEEAVRLLRRPEGASSTEIAPVVRTSSVDAMWRLRKALKKFFPELTLESERMDPARRVKDSRRGPALIYRVAGPYGTTIDSGKKSFVKVINTMNPKSLYLLGVEFGVRQAEKGHNLQKIMFDAEMQWIPSESSKQVVDKRTSETRRDQD